MREDELAGFAAAVLETRRARAALFPDDLLRGEQAWDLLLILFLADDRGSGLTGRQAVERTGGSADVGSRLVKYLTRLGYIVGDGQGDLDDVLAMTPLGLHLMEAWLDSARATFETQLSFSG